MANEITNKSVLVVDADPDVLGFLTLMLEGQGIRVLRARSRREAFELLNRRFVPIDLVVSNRRLIDGGFSRDVKSVRPGMSVVCMSACVDAGVIRIEALKRFDDVALSSPDGRGLLEVIVSELSKPHAHASGV